MSTALDLDLETLVGELEDVPCEHPAHADEPGVHSDEPASHYVQGYCDCGRAGPALPVCPAFAAFARTSGLVRCPACFRIGIAREYIRILGPVNGRAS